MTTKNGKTNGTNGHVAQLTPQQEMEILQRQVTTGYVPTLPVELMFNAFGLPLTSLYTDIEWMLMHPDVRQALSYFKGGISGAEFWGGPNPDNPEDEQGLPVCAENDKVGRFIKEQCERYWDRGVPGLQAAYERGWLGSEQVYEDDGILKWNTLYTFSPLDTYLLTRDHIPVGIRIKNVKGQPRPVDLHVASNDCPAKGMWYAHQPRYNSFYGQSQLYAAWRPWRRLASKDGLEMVIDGAIYRLGYQGPLVRYPNEDLQGSGGVPNTTLNAEGNPLRYSRDIARQIAEQSKAGASIGLPSTRDDKGNLKWEIVWPTSTLQGIDGLLNAAKALRDQITAGIGVPPELLQAADSGSGYSGRRIPLESFLANQQQIADAFLKLFVEQVLKPLVLLNFGDVKFNIQVKSLIKTRTKQAQAGQQGQQQGGINPSMLGSQSGSQPSQAMFSHQQVISDKLREIARRIRIAA